MRRNEASAWAATVARLLLAAVWIAAGTLKAADPAAAVRAVRAYRLLPQLFVRPVAFGLPVVELALGLALLAGLAVRLTALVSAVLLVVFGVAVASAGVRGLQIDCGCFGGGGDVGRPAAYLPELLRDLVLLAVALALARWPVTRLAVGHRRVS